MEESNSSSAARAEARPTLTAEEIAVAMANARFALDNCPVDGGILEEDGGCVSRESVEALQGRLEGLAGGANSGGGGGGGEGLGDEDLKVMRALADYALEDCPIEGGMVLEDGGLVSREDLRAYREKIGAAAPLTAVVG